MSKYIGASFNETHKQQRRQTGRERERGRKREIERERMREEERNRERERERETPFSNNKHAHLCDLCRPHTVLSTAGGRKEGSRY